MQNLHQLFEGQYIRQIIGGDFAKFCGLLTINELYPTIYYLSCIFFSFLYSSLKVDEIERRNVVLYSDTVNEKVPNDDANNFNENGIIEIFVHPVFNAINQLFKQSPSSIKSLMDVALSQSDSNWLQFQDSYDAP